MKRIIFFLLAIICIESNAQYIGIRARYIDTRLVDNSPEQPSRENRMVLSFFEVSGAGIWTPTVLNNYDLWIYKEGLQFGSLMGGVVDSFGNNYPGYAYTAPRVVAYYNSLGLNYIDCDPNVATHYVVNGHELDCGFIRVSHWETDPNTNTQNEWFNAPNVCVPYYIWPHPYFLLPGNVNFNWPEFPPTPPYNWYNFSCGGSLQLVGRGLLKYDSLVIGDPLPVLFDDVKGEIDNAGKATITWCNLTESDIASYIIEKSEIGNPFQTIGTVFPRKNTGDSANYQFETIQVEEKVLYRIKATETTGKIFYSNIIVLNRNPGSVFPDDESSLRVYPNPTQSGRFVLSVTELPKAKYDIILVSATGQHKKISMIDHDGGSINKMFDLHWVTPGMYTLIIRSSELNLTQKIIITN